MTRKLIAALVAAALLGPVPAAADGFGAIYTFSGVTFDDGGAAAGTFEFHFAEFGLPQFYNIQITTGAGTKLPGSAFTASSYCWNQQKQDTCAPGDDLLITLTSGQPGQPGYDVFQFGGWFAPQLTTEPVTLDPAVSYETYCVAPGSCVSRRVAAGEFVYSGHAP